MRVIYTKVSDRIKYSKIPRIYKRKGVNNEKQNY